MPTKRRRNALPRDANERAHMIMDMATGRRPKLDPDSEPTPAELEAGMHAPRSSRTRSAPRAPARLRKHDGAHIVRTPSRRQQDNYDASNPGDTC